MLRESEQHVIFEWVTAVGPVDTSSVVKKPALVGDIETASTGINSPAWIQFLHTFQHIECVGIELDQLVVTPIGLRWWNRGRTCRKGKQSLSKCVLRDFACHIRVVIYLFWKQIYCCETNKLPRHKLLQTHVTPKHDSAQKLVYILWSVVCVMNHLIR
jgi:hypothetical protein